MRNNRVFAALLMATAIIPAAVAWADPTYQPAGQGVPAAPVEVGSSDGNGHVLPASGANPLPTTCISGCSSSAAPSNPSSLLTRPANTTAYAQNELIASSTTVGSVAVPAIALAQGIIGRVRLATNVTAGWGGATLQACLWTTAPTYTNGDGGAYAPAGTGAGNNLVACFPLTLTQFADGAAGQAVASTGGAVYVPTGTYHWDVEDTNPAALTPISQQIFTLTAETLP